MRQLADSVRTSGARSLFAVLLPNHPQDSTRTHHAIEFSFSHTLSCTHTPIQRALTWAVITLAFGFSLASLHACDLIEGRAVFFDLASEDWRPLPNQATRAPLPAVDPVTVPIREAPNQQSTNSFSLGVFRYSDQSTPGAQCLQYSNEFSEKYLDAGSAEGAARFFGCLAAALGGLSMVVFFGLVASDVKKKIYNIVFTCILATAAFCEMLIFSLFNSQHCRSQFWSDFLSLQEQYQVTDNSTTCEMGDGGWFALVAFILFIFAAILVATKWANPVYTVFSMEWTKILDEDDDLNVRVENALGESDLEAGNREEQKPLVHDEPVQPAVQETDDEDEFELIKTARDPADRPDPSMVVDEPMTLTRL